MRRVARARRALLCHGIQTRGHAHNAGWCETLSRMSDVRAGPRTARRVRLVAAAPGWDRAMGLPAAAQQPCGCVGVMSIVLLCAIAPCCWWRMRLRRSMPHRRVRMY